MLQPSVGDTDLPTTANRGQNSTTTYAIGPGLRSHLGAVDFPVTEPQPYDCQVSGEIMKVY